MLQALIEPSLGLKNSLAETSMTCEFTWPSPRNKRSSSEAATSVSLSIPICSVRHLWQPFRVSILWKPSLGAVLCKVYATSPETPAF